MKVQYIILIFISLLLLLNADIKYDLEQFDVKPLDSDKENNVLRITRFSGNTGILVEYREFEKLLRIIHSKGSEDGIFDLLKTDYSINEMDQKLIREVFSIFPTYPVLPEEAYSIEAASGGSVTWTYEYIDVLYCKQLLLLATLSKSELMFPEMKPRDFSEVDTWLNNITLAVSEKEVKSREILKIKFAENGEIIFKKSFK